MQGRGRVSKTVKLKKPRAKELTTGSTEMILKEEHHKQTHCEGYPEAVRSGVEDIQDRETGSGGMTA